MHQPKYFNLGDQIDQEIFSKWQFIYFSFHCKELHIYYSILIRQITLPILKYHRLTCLNLTLNDT